MGWLLEDKVSVVLRCDWRGLDVVMLVVVMIWLLALEAN